MPRTKLRYVRVNPEFTAPSLDPASYMDRTSQFWMAHMFDALVGLDPSGTFVPRAASSWSTDLAGRQYTFHLNPKGRWHDGRAVTAFDFEYSVQRMFHMNSDCRFMYSLLGLTGVSTGMNASRTEEPLGIKALTPSTLQVKLRAPNPNALEIFASQAFYPVRHDQVKEWRASRSAQAVPLGNGPFEYESGDGIHDFTLKKCTAYWDTEKTLIDGISAPHISNVKLDTAHDFLQGQLDIADKLDRDSYHLLIHEKRYPVKFSHPSSIDFILINHRPGRLFSHLKLRKALALTLNRKELIDQIEGGVPGTYSWDRLIPTYMPGLSQPFVEEFDTQLPDMDLDAAKILIVHFKDEHGLAELPPFSIMASNDSERSRVCAYLAERLSEVFETNVTPKVFSMKERYSRQKAGHFDLSVTGWIPEFNDVSSNLTLYHSENPFNRTGYRNPTVDKCLDNAVSEQDWAQRLSLFAQVEQLLLSDVVVVPLYQFSFLYCTAPGFIGEIRRAFGGDPDLRYCTF